MPTAYEESYCNLVRDVLAGGDSRHTRNAPTTALFGQVMTVHELVWGQFPILSGRKLYYKGVMGELAAFLKGPKTIADFTNEGCNYWDKWGNEDGTINVDYGNSWLDYNGVNQLEAVLDSLATDPTGRRHIISGWRPDNLPNLNLPCCHLLYQWYVNDDHLEMIWYQRSVDVMIGLPSDVILAACWNILMAEQLGLQPGKLVFMLGDTHIYESHEEQAYNYLSSALATPDAPVSYFNEGSIYNYNKDSISLMDYNPNDPIKFEVHA